MVPNADTLVLPLRWAAWPNEAQTDEFATKGEAIGYAAKNGGGEVARVRRDASGVTKLGDNVPVDAA